MKNFVRYIGIFLILILMFNILLFLGCLIPSSLIEKNVKESSEILLKEGNQYKVFKYSNFVNNNYTDALMINEAYSVDNTNPIYSYMAVRKNYKKGITQKSLLDTNGELESINSYNGGYDPVGELADFLNGKIDTSINYARYWHGYLPILRILLIFFNIAEIRKILLVIFICLFIIFIKLVKEKIGILPAIIFAFSLIVEDYFLVSYSLDCAPLFLVMMLSCIFLLKNIEKVQNLYIYIFIISCIVNFVDYLTIPLISLAMPLYIFILYQQKNNKDLDYKYYLKVIIKSSCLWILGYGCTWLSKWLIYDLIYKEGLIQSAINQVLYRSTLSKKYATKTIGFVLFKYIIGNLGYVFILFLEVSFVILFLKNIIRVEFISFKIILKQCIPIFIISLMPLVWYIVLKNHTLQHTQFVYRHMIIFLCGILLCLNNVLKIYYIGERK